MCVQVLTYHEVAETISQSKLEDEAHFKPHFRYLITPNHLLSVIDEQIMTLDRTFCGKEMGFTFRKCVPRSPLLFDVGRWKMSGEQALSPAFSSLKYFLISSVMVL